MSFQQPADWNERATMTDPKAEHELLLTFEGVSCRCLGGRAGVSGHTVMLAATRLEGEWHEAYARHLDSLAPAVTQ